MTQSRICNTFEQVITNQIAVTLRMIALSTKLQGHRHFSPVYKCADFEFSRFRGRFERVAAYRRNTQALNQGNLEKYRFFY